MAKSNPATLKQISYAQSLAAQLESLEAGSSSTTLLKSDLDYTDGTWSKRSISDEINRLRDLISEIGRERGIRTDGPSEKQKAFYLRLVEEGFVLAGLDEQDAARNRADAQVHAERYTKAEISKAIDSLLDSNRTLKAQAAEQARKAQGQGRRLKRAHESTRKLQPGQIEQAETPQAPKPQVSTPTRTWLTRDEEEALIGWYATNAKTVLTLVKKTRKGYVAAYRVNLSEYGRDITYIGKRGIQGLKPESKLDAKTLGDLSKLLGLSYCLNCGRTLSDPESIELGLGPICAGKLGQSFTGE